jgi:MFS transporter, MHS family, proline/betaine transporter
LSGTATFDPLVPPRPASGALQIAAATVGNALEWFDILIYGYFATSIAGAFFPNSNPVVSLLLTFGSFGLSYVARPVGAVVLGAYADRAGRKAALTLSIRLMVIGTAVMALMPSYAMVGLVAPICVFAARLLQGFAVAGEFGSSTAFMIEHSTHRKAFFASWQFAGQHLAKVLAALFGVGLTTTLSTQQLHTWGWRIPFLFGLLVGPVGLYIRRKLNETPEFLQSTHTRTPVRELFATEKTGLIVGAGLVAVGTASTYFSIYMPTYATTHLHLPPIPLGGNLADKIGYARMMLPAAVLLLLSFYPLFLFITRDPSLHTLLAGLIFNEFLQDAYVCALAAVMAGIFPARTRVTGLSLSYNLGVTLFGGFAPAVFTWLIAATHNTAAPSFYLMAMAAVSITAVISVKRRTIHT